MLASVGIPYAFDHFDEQDADRPDGPPFICFLYPEEAALAADDGPYAAITTLVVELYTDIVDFALEARLEAALTAADLPCDKERAYIEKERMFQTTYPTEVLLTDE